MRKVSFIDFVAYSYDIFFHTTGFEFKSNVPKQVKPLPMDLFKRLMKTRPPTCPDNILFRAIYLTAFFATVRMGDYLPRKSNERERSPPLGSVVIEDSLLKIRRDLLSLCFQKQLNRNYVLLRRLVTFLPNLLTTPETFITHCFHGFQAKWQEPELCLEYSGKLFARLVLMRMKQG